MAKTEQLIEIKKGKTGSGLLIENDGYISRQVSSNNNKLCESIENGEWHVPYPFIVDAVLQKHGIKNANGRVYPEDTLKREVANYQQLIADNLSLGECYTPDAMCLTAEGWKSIVDVKEGDEILTLNTETDEIEIQKVTYKTENDWDGDMINIHGLHINDIVTPSHGYPVYNRYHKFEKFVTAQEILNGIEKDDLYIPQIAFVEDVDVNKVTKKTKTLDVIQNEIKLDKENIETASISYQGKVYCVEVPNHTWYVMQNGKCHWTKNCNHPESSNIDLSRVSHKIIECHWEGRTLVGKIQLLISEAFRRNGTVCTCGDQVALLLLSGFKIGISSRAVGSVEEKFGQMIVGDDLQLIAWDIVATPSTPGAYIGDGHDLQQYVEQYTNSKPLVENKKIDNILDILNS